MGPGPLHERLNEVQEQGYTVIPDVVPAEACAAIRQSLIATAAEQSAQFSPPAGIGYVPSAINYDQSYVPYLNDRRILDLAEALLGGPLRISFTSITINYPGNDRLQWHSDWPFNQLNAARIPAPYPNMAVHVTTLWMLSPFTINNGGTLLVPGSHLRSTNPTAEGVVVKEFPDEIQATGEAGSVLFMDSRMWHATAANVTREPRVSLAIRYAPWWLNLEVLRPGKERDALGAESDSYNEVPSITRGAFSKLPESIQPLYAHWVD